MESDRPVRWMLQEGGMLELGLALGEEAVIVCGDASEDELTIRPVEAVKHLRNYFGVPKPWRLYGIPFER
ncbi:hypothetical protein O9H85_24710 [Paenibacillus filicis]|uniref:Uncharacterized protein n=1 Tax=Paenibacillus gyeongsangnamensis TaxID=3388067 RepID=A0ABT4QF92_9BACL|nr:hypothetical protein [Paenibacillus filicis]MCZ8515550.1 hypothetical protein [Paenibacillus filicis]